MLLDIGVTSGMKLTQIIELSQVAEKFGLNCVLVGEDIPAPHDVFTVASVVLLKTSKVSVGIGITSPLVRNISTIARASASLNEISGDKSYRSYRLGLGIGGLQDLARMGITVKNPERLLSNATNLLRRMWKGGSVSFESEGFSIKHHSLKYSFGHQIPIFFGVRGPKLLKLAGEIADGVILSGSKTYLKKAISLVRHGIEKSKQPTRNFQFVVWVPTILVEKQSDLNLVRQTVAFVLADTPRKVLEMSELNLDKIEKIKSSYKLHGIAKASRLITEELVEELAIHGSPRKICEAFKSLERLGFQEMVFGPPYGVHPKKALTKLAQAWRAFA